MPLCWIGVIFWSCVAWRRDCAFFELYVLLLPIQNQDIWNFYGSLTLNEGKLISYFGNPWYAIVLNRSHFLILCSMKERLYLFELYMLLVPTQNQDIWNFYSSLTLNKGKLIWFFGSLWYAIVLNRSHFLILCSMKEKLCLFWIIRVACTNTKSRPLAFLRLTDFE